MGQEKIFLESQAHPDPFEQFKHWFKEAGEQSPGDWFMPEAMSIATASDAGEVSSRMLLLKEVDDKGFVFYTNYESRKGADLDGNKNVAMLFYWPHLERQVRIEGVVEKVSKKESGDYFHSRPRGSQLGAWASAQSAIVANREELDQRFANIEAQYADKEIPLPEFWGGYRLLPRAIEFWQGRSNRLHDRLLYQKESGTWTIKRLCP